MVVRGAHVWSVLIAFIVHVLSGILLYLSQSLNAYYYRSCQQYDGESGKCKLRIRKYYRI